MLDTRNLARPALRLVLAGLLLCCAPPADGGQFAANLNGHADGDVDLADAGIFQQVFTGPRGGSGAAPSNPYYFTGRRVDFDLRDGNGRPLLVLSDYRAREYDPWHGHFVQRDPAEYADSLNLYEYVRSNPLVSTDPSGRQLVDVLMATLGQSQLRGQEAYRAGVAGGLVLSMLGAYITYNEFGQMQWSVGGGMSASGFDLFVEGVEATMSGAYAIGESLILAAEAMAIAVFMSQADAVKKALSLEGVIRLHFAKIATGGGGDWGSGPEKWRRDIEAFLKQIESLTKHMGRKTAEKWIEWIQRTRDALEQALRGGGNMPPPMPG